MTTKKLAATADLQILDSGKGVLLTINAVDAAGNPTAWPSGAPAPTAVASDAAPDGTGSAFSFESPVATPTGFTIQADLVSPQPTPLHTGVVFNLTVASGFPNQTAPISVAAAPPVDVVAGPANSFVVQEAGD